MLSKTTSACLLAIVLFQSNHTQAQQEGPYKTDPASVRKPDVPRGKIIRAKFANSKVFPGTERDYAIYVPKQYDPKKPACLMVFQDGIGFLNERGPAKTPIVFDNLIHSGEMPVTIGLFINPGVIPAQNEKAQARYNRSLEYDAIDDRYAKFLVDELLPVIKKDYAISDDPNDRGICGSSSGGIAAFNVAWQRPDQFRRVYTMVGTYIGLRGANEMSVLVRKTEPKPIRIYLQDGSNDLNIYCGDWWVANQGMLSALKFGGYEVEHVWGQGGHNKKQGGAVLPNAMRYIWKDWPKKVETHLGKRGSRAPEVLIDGEKWNLVHKIDDKNDHLINPVTDNAGNLYFASRLGGDVFKFSKSGETSVLWTAKNLMAVEVPTKQNNRSLISGLSLNRFRELHVVLPFRNSIVKIGPDSDKLNSLASNVNAQGIVVANDNTIYFTDPQSKSLKMLQPGGGAPQTVAEGLSGAHGVTLSPDQTLIYVSDSNGRYVWSSVRNEDGTLTYHQPYFHIHSPPAAVDMRTHSNGMCVDKDGWVLVATKMGIQVCDQPGRVNFIISSPVGAGYPSHVSFGGPKNQTLFASFGNKIYKRKVKLTGAQPWASPVKPPKPRL